MAFSTTAILAKLIEEQVPDLRLKNAVLLDYLAANGRCVNGTQQDLYWNAITLGSTAAVATMATAGVDQTQGDAVQATLAVGAHKIYHQFNVSLVDLNNAKYAGVGALKNMFGQSLKGGLISIRRQLNALLYSGDGTPASAGIFGLNFISNPANVAYAGISSATYPLWTAVGSSNAGTNRALTRALLYDYTRILEEQETYNEALICTPTLAQTYTTLFDTIAGANAIPQSMNLAAMERRMVDLAAGNRYYNGAPVLTDPQATGNQLFGIRPDSMNVVTMDLGDADMGQLAALGLKSNVNSIASADVGGLRVNVALLPQTNPGVIQVQMFVIPQLKIENRRSLTHIRDLT